MAIVAFYDINEEEIVSWARANCPTFVCWLVYESNNMDEEWLFRYEFEFTDNQEAMVFQLRWQGQ